MLQDNKAAFCACVINSNETMNNTLKTINCVFERENNREKILESRLSLKQNTSILDCKRRESIYPSAFTKYLIT